MSAPSNTLEAAARSAWLAEATQAYLGRCDACGANRTPDGRHRLLVARQPRRTERECLPCFDARISGYEP